MKESGVIIIFLLGIYAIQHVSLASNVFARKATPGIGIFISSVAILITFCAVWVFQAMRYIP